MVDPYDLPSVSPSVIGFDTSGQPVFAPPSRTVAELARVTDAPISRQTRITRRGGGRFGGVTAQDVALPGFIAERRREREILSAYLDAQAKQAREAEARRQKIIAESKAQAEQLKLQQEAKRRGRTIQQLKQEKQSERQEQLEAIQKSEGLRGRELTRLQTQRAFGGAKGVSALRRGIAREQRAFRKTGVSAEQLRRERKLTFVSENVIKDLKQRALAGDKLAEQQLNRIGHSITFTDVISGDTRQDVDTEPTTPRGIIAQRYVEFGEPLIQKTRPILSKVLPERIETFLFEKRIPFDITETVIALGATPYLMTTPQTKALLLEREIIKPITQTKFVALAKEKAVRVVSTTDVGGVKTAGVSEQVIRQQTDDLILGTGKGISVVGRGGGERQITKFDILGVNKQLGQARAVFDISDDATRTAVAQEIGVGVQSRVLTQDVAVNVQREGIGLIDDITKNIKFDLPRFESATFSPTGKVSFKTTIKTADITGVITPSKQEGIMQFIGKTGKPITRISKEGVVKVLREPNIAGIIKTISKSGDDVTRVISQKTITQTIEKSVAQQIGSLTNVAEQTIIKDIVKPSFIKDISKIVPSVSAVRTRQVSRTRFADQTKALTKELDVQRFEPLGILQGRLRTTQRVKQVSKLKPLTQLRSLLSEKELLKEITPVKQKAVTKVKQQPRQKFLLRLNLKQVLGEPGMVTPFAFKVPKIPKIPELIIFPFPKLTGKRKKKKRIKGRRRIIDEIYSPGFTATTLGLTKELTLKELKGLSPLGLRPIPIIKRRKKR